MKQFLKDILVGLIAAILALGAVYLISTAWHLGAFEAVRIHELGARIKGSPS